MGLSTTHAILVQYNMGKLRGLRHKGRISAVTVQSIIGGRDRTKWCTVRF